MPVTLTTPAIEESTYAIVVSFQDDAGASVAPNAGLTWTLLKKVAGVETVVNDRLNVAIGSAASVTIVLSGPDLALVEGESKSRWVLLKGSYNSNLGTNLSLREELAFQIVNLVGL